MERQGWHKKEQEKEKYIKQNMQDDFPFTVEFYKEEIQEDKKTIDESSYIIPTQDPFHPSWMVCSKCYCPLYEIVNVIPTIYEKDKKNQIKMINKIPELCPKLKRN